MEAVFEHTYETLEAYETLVSEIRDLCLRYGELANDSECFNMPRLEFFEKIMFSHFRVGNIASIRVVRDILKGLCTIWKMTLTQKKFLIHRVVQLQLQITINLKN